MEAEGAEEGIIDGGDQKRRKLAVVKRVLEVIRTVDFEPILVPCSNADSSVDSDPIIDTQQWVVHYFA